MAKTTTKIISTSRPVKTSCKNTKVRTASGACAPERKPMMKKGGSTKSFPDLNKDGKVTKADILIGKKVIPKAQKGIITDSTKYRPWDSPNVKRVPYMDPREILRLEHLKLEQKERLKENQDNYKINNSTGKMEYTGPKSAVKKLGGATHPGFKAVQSKIAAKQGISKEAAGAILASSARKASAKAKTANPRLKKVK